jgi:dTDP-4-amino-4,6-dideoxygalactose transaminase
MNIPFLDLKRVYSNFSDALKNKLEGLISAHAFVLGPEVESLEKEIAEFCGTKHAIGVASGTDALVLSLRATGIEKNDAVITTPFSFIATASSIVLAGGVPVFVDISERTFNLCSIKLEEHLRKKAKKKRDGWYLKQNGEHKLRAVIPVHLYGQCANMDRIISLAREFKLKVIEDTAQALGSECRVDGDTMRAGGVGDAGAISFYPTKNLGGLGDGGMVVTNSKKIADMVRTLRIHGMGRKKYIHQYIGYNSRLDALQAAGLRIKFPFLDKWNLERIALADRYRKLFKEKGIDKFIIPPEVMDGNKHIYHQFVVRVKKKRDALQKFLKENGIGTEIYYPLPLHLQPCFKNLGYRTGDLPEAELASREVLALPIYPGLKEEEQRYVAEKIEEFFRE